MRQRGWRFKPQSRTIHSEQDFAGGRIPSPAMSDGREQQKEQNDAVQTMPHEMRADRLVHEGNLVAPDTVRGAKADRDDEDKPRCKYV